MAERRRETGRAGGRPDDALRPLAFRRGFTAGPPGSVLVEQGRTVVLCTATVEESVPAFLEASGDGWVTAEYAMLPASTPQRRVRDVSRLRPEGRGQEIQRLLGRCLRAAVDRRGLGPRTIWVDCDVLQADGGTRMAALNGGFLALADALAWMREEGLISEDPLRAELAGVSVGLVDGRALLDLDYAEDSRAAVDLNAVCAADGRLVEVQAAAEGEPFAAADFERLLALARRGVEGILAARRAAAGKAR